MHNFNSFLITTLFLFIVFSFPRPANAQIHYFTNLKLDGGQEVPPNASSAFGLLNATYDANTMTLAFSVNFEGLSSNTSAAHFHGPAVPGINAGVAIGWTGFPTGVTSGTYSNSFVLNSTQESELLSGLWYANIHTSMYPGGEIRGQLFETSPIHSFTFLVMEGGQEVPPVTTAGMGIINATYNLNTNMLDFTADFSGLAGTTTAAHFHGPAPAGTNAGVQIGWSGFPTGVTSGTFSDVVSLNASQEADLLAGLWYANIHTTVHPGGEIRAQMIDNPTVDGNLSDPKYQTIATKLNTNAGFGSAIDVSKLVYYADASAEQLYIGIEGKLNTGSNDGIGLWLGFNELTGSPAGTSLGGAPGGHYMGGDGGANPNFNADFEVDYMFAFNPGSSSTDVYIDGVKLVGGRVAQYLGNVNQSGTSAANINSDFFSAGSVEFAFNNNGELIHGLEMRIPFSQLGVTQAGNVNAFTFVTSGSGFFSDVTVPGNVTGGNPGFNTSFNSISGGPYNTGSHPLPVELLSFTASVSGRSVILGWNTATEINNRGFEIQRLQHYKITELQDWETIGFVSGFGTTTETKAYTFTDENVSSVNYFYRLKQIDLDGSFEFSNVIEVHVSIPDGFVLEQNYPNPFNPGTKIKFGFSSITNAELTVYDVLGRQVASLFNEVAEAGRIYEIDFNASELSSGVYYYKLSGNGKTEIKKMLMLK